MNRFGAAPEKVFFFFTRAGQFTHHSVQHALSGRFPGVQGHASLLQQFLAHHLDLGLCLNAFLQAVEALLCRQLEGVDLSCGHVQDVDHLEEKTQHDQ